MTCSCFFRHGFSQLKTRVRSVYTEDIKPRRGFCRGKNSRRALRALSENPQFPSKAELINRRRFFDLARTSNRVQAAFRRSKRIPGRPWPIGCAGATNRRATMPCTFSATRTEAGTDQASDGNICGTTSDGGSTGSGTVFKITSTGTLTTVHNLDPKNGNGAFLVGLVQHSNGIFYRPTVRGGKIVYHFCPAFGTLFSLSVP
jgi:uncharacterized repeat protein (TIGR03803 family)